MENVLPIFLSSFVGFFPTPRMFLVGFFWLDFLVSPLSNCILFFVTQENTELLTDLIQSQKCQMFLRWIFQQMEAIQNQWAVFSQRRNCGPA